MPATKRHTLEDNWAIVREATAEDLASLVSELEQRKKALTVVNAIAGVAARSPEITDILDQSIRRLFEVMERIIRSESRPSAEREEYFSVF